MSAQQSVSALVGSATRYIAGRNAVQTVYWRAKDADGTKLIKYNRTCTFDRSFKLPKRIQIPIDIKYKS